MNRKGYWYVSCGAGRQHVLGAVAPGGAVRRHLLFRPNTERQAHWNNEAKPLQVWLAPPDGWPVEHHVLAAPLPPEPVSEELRSVEFELLVPADASQGTTHVTATAFYYVCEDRDGTYLFYDTRHCLACYSGSESRGSWL